MVILFPIVCLNMLAVLVLSDLSIGVTSADAPIGLLWTQIVGMFLGRLEFFTVFIGIVRLFQDIPAIFGGK